MGVVPLSVPGAVAELLEAQGEVSTGRPCLSCGEPWLSRIRDYLDAPFHPDWPENRRLSVAGIFRALERAHERGAAKYPNGLSALHKHVVEHEPARWRRLKDSSRVR